MWWPNIWPLAHQGTLGPWKCHGWKWRETSSWNHHWPWYVLFFCHFRWMELPHSLFSPLSILDRLFELNFEKQANGEPSWSWDANQVHRGVWTGGLKMQQKNNQQKKLCACNKFACFMKSGNREGGGGRLWRSKKKKKKKATRKIKKIFAPPFKRKRKSHGGLPRWSRDWRLWV